MTMKKYKCHHLVCNLWFECVASITAQLHCVRVMLDLPEITEIPILCSGFRLKKKCESRLMLIENVDDEFS
eukprot:m.1679925 g.1679925  ORF g.1679925 m.1679925 type:complete len:71 (-) comp220030_c0_seq1:48-260(-)